MRSLSPSLLILAVSSQIIAGCACPPGSQCIDRPADPVASHENQALVSRLAEQSTERWAPADLTLDWSQSVLAWGFLRAHANVPDAGHDTFGTAWIEGALPDFTGDDPRTFNSSDSMSPTSVASSLMADDPSRDYTLITDAANLYLDEVPRTADGAIPHWGPEHPLFGDTLQVWVDSQFMVGMTWLQEYRRTGDASYLDDWVEQYRLFSDLCRDPDDQLYRHAWDDVAEENIPPEAVYWNRGNSWVLISAAEFLRLAPGHADAGEIELLFRAHLDATLALQRDDGLFWTVLNAPFGNDARNYPETSGSALIGYSIAAGIRANILPIEAYGAPLSRIVRGVRDLLWEEDDRLMLQGTSFGTNPGDYDNYVNTAVLPDQIVGVGATLMLLSESQGLPDPLEEAQ
ncbi:MAG: glycoside hydrolase family 88 protein [Deltaproteobacteria bacterium]|nr:glycoside hydrolase family 88 protein [Deltaproteobacteria bacterium]